MKSVKYSFVTAAYNEEEALPVFFSKIIPLAESTRETFEIIVINDGSSDKTEEILKDRCFSDARIKGISLSRNFGQQAALLAGLKESRGEAVIVMDADLQDPPETALEMIEKFKEGYDVVHAHRRSRKKDGFLKRVTAAAYYRFLNRISDRKVPENVGDFKLYSKRAVNAVLSMPESNRYLKSQSVWVGFKQCFVEFDRPPRAAGKTKYTFKKLFRLALNGIISNSNYPLTLNLKCGVTLGIISAAAFVTFIIMSICGVHLPLTAWLFPFLGALFSLNMTVKGFTDIYTDKIYEEVKKRPVYVIKDKYNCKDEDE